MDARSPDDVLSDPTFTIGKRPLRGSSRVPAKSFNSTRSATACRPTSSPLRYGDYGGAFSPITIRPSIDLSSSDSEVVRATLAKSRASIHGPTKASKRPGSAPSAKSVPRSAAKLPVPPSIVSTSKRSAKSARLSASTNSAKHASPQFSRRPLRSPIRPLRLTIWPLSYRLRTLVRVPPLRWTHRSI